MSKQRQVTPTNATLLGWINLHPGTASKRGERGLLREARNECGAQDQGRRKMKLLIIFLLPSSRTSHSFRASRKMPRSPRLAHKAPIMQATVRLKVFFSGCGFEFSWLFSRQRLKLFPIATHFPKVLDEI